MQRYHVVLDSGARLDLTKVFEIDNAAPNLSISEGFMIVHKDEAIVIVTAEEAVVTLDSRHINRNNHIASQLTLLLDDLFVSHFRKEVKDDALNILVTSVVYLRTLNYLHLLFFVDFNVGLLIPIG